MNKLLYILYQPYKWLIFFPLFAINTLIFGTSAVVVSLLINQKIGSYIGGVLWSRLNSLLTPIRVKVLGKSNIKTNTSYVIVANHISAYDIFVLYGWIGVDFKWVMKKEIEKVPAIGFGSKAVGHIFIDRSSTKAAMETINEAKQKIKGGTSVAFFPEGTRSKTGKLSRFKKGAFHFAFDLNLPILPVTIRGTDNIIPPGTLDLRPGKAQLIIHEPLDIKQYGKENLQTLMDDVRNTIASALPDKNL